MFLKINFKKVITLCEFAPPKKIGIFFVNSGSKYFYIEFIVMFDDCSRKSWFILMLIRYI